MTLKQIPSGIQIRRRTALWCLMNLTIGVGSLWIGISSEAQSQEKFKARLSSVPPLRPATPASVVGAGAVSASLTGAMLSVNGTFEKLASPVTVARLHMGSVTGVRGDPVFDLTVSKGTAGTITGSFNLTAAQVEALRKGRFYVQLHSEGAPTGNLLGWLLK